MAGSALGLVIIVLAIGAAAGWHASRAHAAHGDIKTVRGRIPGYRKTRLRSGLIVIGLTFASLLILRGMI